MSPLVFACCTLWLLLRLAQGGHTSNEETRPARKRFLNAVNPQVGFARGLQSVQVVHDGIVRRYVVYVPTHYSPNSPVPLWILAHGTANTPEAFIKMTDMAAMAEKHTFAFAAPEALNGAFNVGRDAQAQNLSGPDDVGYTRTILQEVRRRLNVDMQRIRCAGFSRGARFCSRLASELSSFITGIAVVSGIRFPKPNNATRPLPIIAFHGTEDPVNPYNGKGNAYWLSSVDDAVQRWADFNGCTEHRWERVSTQVLKSLHTGCTDGADVVLVQIVKGGHTWPGSWYDFGRLGYVTHEIDASDLLREFFLAHPVREHCHTAVEGDLCYDAVMWAKQVGIYRHPEWYGGLTSGSASREFQANLHERIGADCPTPCLPLSETVPHASPAPAATPVTPSSSTTALAARAPGTPGTRVATRAGASTNGTWVTLRWLEKEEPHAGVMQRYGIGRLALLVMQRYDTGRWVLLVAGALVIVGTGVVMAFRAYSRTRGRALAASRGCRPLRLQPHEPVLRKLPPANHILDDPAPE
mmetsp:Transcript_108702/g.325147  ORF Transcript_108702/g.325147 Transcript_108702/m.325147 type:complete len:526 (-) Transcript_108702:166-1743(-)